MYLDAEHAELVCYRHVRLPLLLVAVNFNSSSPFRTRASSASASARRRSFSRLMAAGVVLHGLLR